MNSAGEARRERLEGFLDRLRAVDLGELVDVLRRERRTEAPAELLEVYLNEVRVGLDLVEPFLQPGVRILEIGCGAGVLTSFLKAEGFEILGIEPGGGGGFSFMPALQRTVARDLDETASPEVLPITAEELKVAEHGRFDLIFSVNVLEHVMRLEEAMAALAEVLESEGRMVHTCPNYAFPYEPHLSIPLVPWAPSLTRFVFSRTIKRHRAIWQTVNFVTARRLQRIARDVGLVCELEPGVIARSFARVVEDPIFRQRHEGLITRIATSRVLAPVALFALKRLPPGLATPMVVQMVHRRT